jgi:hypothetical protein
MIEIKAPEPVPMWNNLQRLFLAGSIEMGAAESWQDKFAKAMDRYHITILNPRRDDWDASWEQSIDNPQFNEQVNWELDNITRADFVVFYFDPNTKSPITLMELGWMAALGKTKGYCSTREVFVCCPPGFWRKGNVDIMCKRAGIPVVETLEELAQFFHKEGDEQVQ